MRKTRKASMMRSEFDVLVRYDSQSSAVALERPERETESLLEEEECMMGSLEEGAEETVGGASDLAVFFGAMVGELVSRRRRSWRFEKRLWES
jgi:hypothetical protein